MVKRLKDIGFVEDSDEDEKPQRKRRHKADDDTDDDDDLPSRSKAESPFSGEIVAPEYEESRLHSGQLEFLSIVRVLSDPDLQGRLWPRFNEDQFASAIARSIFTRVKTLQNLGKEFPSISTLAIDPALPKPSQAALSVFISSAENGRLQSDVDIGNGIRVPVSSSADFEGHVYDLLEAYRITRQSMEKLVAVSNKLSDEGGFDPLNAPAWFERVAVEILALRGKEAIADALVHYGINTTKDEDIKRESEIDKIFATERLRFKTGFKAFDDKAGGFQPGEVVLMGANSGGGKTAMALSTMVNMAKMGTSVAMLQLELTNSQVNERLSANLANLDADAIRTGKLTEKQKRLVKDSHDEFHEDLKAARSRFTIFAPSSATIQECEYIFKSFPYRVWFIDYINLLKWDNGKQGDTRSGEDWTRLSDIVKEFKRIAKKYGICVVLLVQINVEKESGDMSIRYAKAMLEHADIVQVWNLTADAKKDGMVWIRHLKARQYEMFDYAVRVALDKGRFESIDMTLLPKPEEKKLGSKKKVRDNDDADAPSPFKKKEKPLPAPVEETKIPDNFSSAETVAAFNNKPRLVVVDSYAEMDE